MAKQVTNAVLAEKLETLTKIVEKIEETVNGNGTPGMKTRIAQLEKSEENRTWHIRGLWSAALAALAKFIIG